MVQNLQKVLPDSLDLLWQAFLRSAPVSVENSLESLWDTRNSSLGTNLGSTFYYSETGAGVDQSIYIGQPYDAESSLDYLNARYYDGGRGQFLSEDPVFLEDPSQQNVTDPQSLNSYSYARDNPIIKSDPSGRAFGVDDIAGIGVGGLIGAGIYVGESAITQQQLTWGGLTGSAVSGAIVGWGAVNTPETLGASDAIAAAALYGGAGGFVGNGTKQVIDVGTGAQKGYSATDLGVSTAFGTVLGGATEGVIPDASIEGLSSGRGNMNAVGEAMQTKLANGTISNVSFGTAVKSAVGSQAANAYRTIAGILADISRTLYTISQQNSQPSSTHK